MAESEEELKSLLMKVKTESEKPGLKLNIQKPKIVASSPKKISFKSNLGTANCSVNHSKGALGEFYFTYFTLQ